MGSRLREGNGQVGFENLDWDEPDPYLGISWGPLPENTTVGDIELLDKEGRGFKGGQWYDKVGWMSGRIGPVLYKYGCSYTETSLKLTRSCWNRYALNGTKGIYPPPSIPTNFIRAGQSYEVRVSASVRIEEEGETNAYTVYSPIQQITIPSRPKPTPTPLPSSTELSGVEERLDILHVDLKLILEELRLLREITQQGAKQQP